MTNKKAVLLVIALTLLEIGVLYFAIFR